MKLRPVTARVKVGYPTDLSWKTRLLRWSRRALGAAVVALSIQGCGGVETSNRAAPSMIASTGSVETAPDDREIAPRISATEQSSGSEARVVDDTTSEALEVSNISQSIDGTARGTVPQVVVRRNLIQCNEGPRVRGGGALPPPNHCFTCAPTVPLTHQAQRFPLYDGEGELCGDQISWALLEVGADTRARVWMYSQSDPPGAEIRLIAPDGTEAAKLTPTVFCVELDLEAGQWTLAAAPVSPESDRRARFMVYVIEAL